MPEEMTPEPEPLTEREAQRLRNAIAEGKLRRDDYDWQRRDRAELGPGLEKLLRAWQALPEAVRETVLEDLGHALGAETIRHGAFEEAIRERLDLIAYRRPATVPGLYEAVAALRQIWTERGKATGGNHYRAEAEGSAPHPMLAFLGHHVLAELPETGGNAAGYEQRLRRAIAQAETQLRKLRDVPPEYR